MGAGSYKSVLGLFREQDWSKLYSHDNVTTLRNNLSGLELDLHRMYYEDESSFQQASATYRKRLRVHSNVVNLYDMVVLETSTCSSQRSILLLFEKITGRLSEHQGVVHEECLVILEEALFGCKEIRDLTGKYFLPSGEMIQLNSNNQIRLWFDPDVTRNRPRQQISEIDVADPEDSQINALARVVEEYCQDGAFNPSFTAAWRQVRRPLRYISAIEALRKYQQKFATDVDSMQRVNPFDSSSAITKPRAKF